jgi:hypothetical protein
VGDGVATACRQLRRSRSAAQLNVRDHGPIRRFRALAGQALPRCYFAAGAPGHRGALAERGSRRVRLNEVLVVTD